jgi:hypothetical protein
MTIPSHTSPIVFSLGRFSSPSPPFPSNGKGGEGRERWDGMEITTAGREGNKREDGIAIR